MMINLDIIIPLYKSKLILPDLIKQLNSWIKVQDFRTKVIFVDDGSADGTFECLKEILKDYSIETIKIKLSKNYGQHTATAIGFFYSTASLVATMDDDLQHDPIEFNQLIQELIAKNADLIYGVYEEKKHSKTRNLGSRVLKKLMQIENTAYEHVTSFRLMKSNVIDDFKAQKLSVVFLDEYLIENAGIQVTVPVSHAKRPNGDSGYSNWKLIKTTLNILIFHSSLPLKIIIRFGLLMSLIFFSVGCYYIYQKLVNNIQIGFTSIVVSIFFSTGMILLSLGIIGEYIRKIWAAQNKINKVNISERC